MTGETISHFKVLEKLGGGGMGVVYAAEDLHLDRRVALKFLPPHLATDEEAKQRFVQEARAASALNHANICTVHDIDETDDGQLFIAMAHYEGETLKAKLASGPLPTEEAVDIARQVAEGLAAAHEQGIIHRDIKPANIFITKRGRAVILDFGLAKLTGSLDLTKSGSTLGTAHYMSSEQIRSEEVDGRTDIWSLGVVLYEMLSGRRPFDGDYEQAISYAILNEEPERLPDQTAFVEGIVQSCLKKKPGERTEDAATLASRLRTIAATTTESVAVASPRSKRPWIFAAVVAPAAVVMALLLVTRLTSDEGAKEPAVLEGLVVMPFTVRGDESLEYLSEGMVDLLSLALDGVGGRRSVDAGLVLAEIRRSDLDADDPSQAQALARKFGARDFVMGTVMRVGRHVRFSATTYDREGNIVAQVDVEIEEVSDELIPAIDQLTQKLVSLHIESRDQGRLGVAAMTTASIPALRAYLEGERALREGRWEDARIVLRQAVELDSAFAVAWWRLGEAEGWDGSRRLATRYIFKAAELADDLPDRFQKLLAGEAAMLRGHGAEAERLFQSLTREYPADATAWFKLGDFYWHHGPMMARSMLDAKEPLQRAFHLDPSNAEVLYHLIAGAVMERRFSDADSLLNRGPLEWDRRRHDLTLALASADQRSTRDSLIEMASSEVVWPTMALRWTGLLSPRPPRNHEMETAELLNLKFSENSSLFEAERQRARTNYILYRFIRTGRWRDVQHRVTSGPDWPDRELVTKWYVATSPMGAVMEGEFASLRSRILDTYPIDEEPWFGRFEGQESFFRAFMVGMLSVRMEDWQEVERQEAFLTSTDGGVFAEGFQKTLAAFMARHRGERTTAFELGQGVLLPLTQGDWISGRSFDRHLRASLMMEDGRFHEALRLWESLGQSHHIWQVPTYLYRAQCYEAMGEADRAIALYQLFADLWKDADPELQPMVEEARAGLERLLDAEVREPS